MLPDGFEVRRSILLSYGRIMVFWVLDFGFAADAVLVKSAICIPKSQIVWMG